MTIKTLKPYRKELLKFEKILKHDRGPEFNFFKVLSLSFLTCEIEKTLTNPKNPDPVLDIIKTIKKYKEIYLSTRSLNIFQNKKKSNYKFNFRKNHKELWQKIWPTYHDKKEFLELINYRGKRLDYNKIHQFKNKDILDLGCGNGSISFACIKRGAKSATCVDYGKKNIQTVKYWAQKMNYSNKMNFICKDILKFNTKKRFDFIICSAVLHHLKNYNEILKVSKIIINILNKGGYYYFYIKGKGGIRYDFQVFCQKNLINIDPNEIKNILLSMNFNINKLTHLLDWHKAIYIQTNPKKIIKDLARLGFKNFVRLKGPHLNDLDINQIETHKLSTLKFGTGELRYICRKK